MTLVVVPPLGDPTVALVPGRRERLLDLNLAFAHRMGDPATLQALADRLDAPAPDVPGSGGAPDTGQRCLLALAAADALSGPVPPSTRLRALGAAIRAVSADDPGLTASLDDIVLREGSTQSSDDALLAAGRSALFDPELIAVGPAAAHLAVGDPVEIVVDTDQQVPAAFQIAARLAGTTDVVLAGRFVARYAEALRRVPVLDGVRLSGRVRRREIRREYLPAHLQAVPPVWVTARNDLPAAGPWAGWLDATVAAHVTAAQWERCAGLVLSATGPDDLAGDTTGGSLAPVLQALAARIPVALEVVADPAAGLPGDPDTAGRTWWGPWLATLRLAGFRPWRRPAASGPQAAGGRNDLARWAPGPPTRPLVPPDWVLARHDLFPGRVAGALFAGSGPATAAGAVVRAGAGHDAAAGYRVDPAVRAVRLRHLSPDDGPPGDFLVDLRRGRLSRVQPSLARLARHLAHQPGPDGGGSLAVLGPVPDERVLTGLYRAGVLRREPAA